MNVPRNVEFPEYTNPGINAALVADKLNETLAFLRDKYPEPKPENAFERKLAEGVYLTKTGKFAKKGKKGLVKESEAYDVA